MHSLCNADGSDGTSIAAAFGRVANNTVGKSDTISLILED